MIRPAAVLIVALLGAQASLAECVSDAVSLRGPWGMASFRIELAQTPEERSRGLMHRETMARNAGMMFVFDPPQRVQFWMKNTLIPLDMIFVDRSGVVGRVHANAIPHDETGIPGIDHTYAVLEINGGLAETFGIDVGTELRHPVFGAGAAWPCPEALR